MISVIDRIQARDGVEDDAPNRSLCKESNDRDDSDSISGILVHALRGLSLVREPRATMRGPGYVIEKT